MDGVGVALRVEIREYSLNELEYVDKANLSHFQLLGQIKYNNEFFY